MFVVFSVSADFYLKDVLFVLSVVAHRHCGADVSYGMGNEGAK